MDSTHQTCCADLEKESLRVHGGIARCGIHERLRKLNEILSQFYETWGERFVFDLAPNSESLWNFVKYLQTREIGKNWARV